MARPALYLVVDYQPLPLGYLRGFLRGDGYVRPDGRMSFYQCSPQIIDDISRTLEFHGLEVSRWSSPKAHSVLYAVEVRKGSVARYHKLVDGQMSWEEVAGFLDTDGTIKVRHRPSMSLTPELSIVWTQSSRNRENLVILADFLCGQEVTFTMKSYLSAGYPQVYLRVPRGSVWNLVQSVLPHLRLKREKAEELLTYV